MVEVATKLISSTTLDPKDKVGLEYQLVCLFISIAMNQVHLLLPNHSTELKSIITALVDIDLATRTPNYENGVLSLQKKQRKSIIGS